MTEMEKCGTLLNPASPSAALLRLPLKKGAGVMVLVRVRQSSLGDASGVRVALVGEMTSPHETRHCLIRHD
jgi:hypothetical protein